MPTNLKFMTIKTSVVWKLLYKMLGNSFLIDIHENSMPIVGEMGIVQKRARERDRERDEGDESE